MTCMRVNLSTYLLVEDAEEDEGEENPIAIEFQEEPEAFYLKDPKKALQGFFDREGMDACPPYFLGTSLLDSQGFCLCFVSSS